MSQRANVTSVDALKVFRSNLIVYLSKARPCLEEVSAEVMRTRLWLQTEKRTFWEAHVKRLRKKLEEAQANLFGARLSTLREAAMAEQLAVSKAKKALQAAEAKLASVKQWDREFDNRVEPLLRQLEKLQTILSHDMPKAAVYLAQASGTLDAYAGVAVPVAQAAPAPPGNQTPVEPSQTKLRNMKSSAVRLEMLTRALSNQWQETKLSWQDAKSLEFEKKYMEELLASVNTAVTVMEKVDKLVTKIRNDCE